MSLSISSEPIPLVTDADEVIRVGSTRVTLDSVIAAYLNGYSAETIAEQYPSVPLSEIYAVLSYYLKHRESVDAYLQQRQVKRAEVRVENEARFSPVGIRSRLLLRLGHSCKGELWRTH